MNMFRRTDRATLAGLTIAFLGLLAGMRFEGIQLYEVTQISAALIVFCGTLGAVLMSTPSPQCKKALRLLPSMFWHGSTEPETNTCDLVLKYARAARSRGLTSLEKEVESITIPFFRKGMRLAVDGVDSKTIRDILEADLAGTTAESEAAATLYEAAAGYAPTFGIAGAAIGLVQVMKHLDNIEQVGSGVAAAFVATIYGILLANLVLLPIASKIRARSEAQVIIYRSFLEGVLQIAAGSNPMLIQQRLEPLTPSRNDTSKPAGWQAVSAEAHS
jgi:chemotaxis protein MotA